MTDEIKFEKQPAPVAYQENGQVRLKADDLLLDPEDAEQFAEHLQDVIRLAKAEAE